MHRGFKTCPKCQSESIKCPLYIFEDTGNYNSSFKSSKIGYLLNPNALILKQKKMEDFHACGCLECGYLEFYLSNQHR